LISILSVFMFFPFLTLCLVLSILVLLSVKYESGRAANLFFCLLSAVVLAPLIATKLPLDRLGNDKSQYLSFMNIMGASGVQEFLKVQPELLSFSAIFLAWKLTGPTDVAFFLLFVVFFLLALLAVWRADYRAVPLFLIITLASSAFYSSYGNVIRQAMAFPFIFLLVQEKKRKYILMFAFLAAIAHIPSLMVTMPYVLYRFFGRLVIWLIGILSGIIFIFSKFFVQGLSVLGGDGGGYLSKKAEIYTNWDSFSVIGIVTMTLAIFLVNNVVWKRVLGNHKFDDKSIGRGLVYQLLCFSNFCLFPIFATLSLSKVVERVYIYFFVISIFYLSVAIPKIRSDMWKFVACLAIVAYSAFGISKNLLAQDLLYGGQTDKYVTGNLIEIYEFVF
jgi:hypothetical protein